MVTAGFDDIDEDAEEAATGNFIIRNNHRYILDTSDNSNEIYPLARIVFQQWLSNNQGSPASTCMLRSS